MAFSFVGVDGFGFVEERWMGCRASLGFVVGRWNLYLSDHEARMVCVSEAWARIEDATAKSYVGGRCFVRN